METETVTNTEKSAIGTSLKNDFQEALKNAIENISGPEIGKSINWKLDEVYGVKKDLTKNNSQLFVKIKYE